MSKKLIEEQREVVEDEIMLALRNLRQMLVRAEDMDTDELLRTGKILQVLNSLMILQSLADCDDGDIEQKQEIAKQTLGVYNRGTRALVERYLYDFELCHVAVHEPSVQMFSLQ